MESASSVFTIPSRPTGSVEPDVKTLSSSTSSGVLATNRAPSSSLPTSPPRTLPMPRYAQAGRERLRPTHARARCKKETSAAPTEAQEGSTRSCRFLRDLPPRPPLLAGGAPSAAASSRHRNERRPTPQRHRRRREGSRRQTERAASTPHTHLDRRLQHMLPLEHHRPDHPLLRPGSATRSAAWAGMPPPRQFGGDPSGLLQTWRRRRREARKIVCLSASGSVSGNASPRQL